VAAAEPAANIPGGSVTRIMRESSRPVTVTPSRDTGTEGPLPDTEDAPEPSGYPARMAAADACRRDVDRCPPGTDQQGQHTAAPRVTFGKETRRLMAEQRVGLRELARQVHYDPGYLSKVVNDRKVVSGTLARRLDAALDAGGVLAAFRAIPDLRGTFVYDDGERLILAARCPKPVDREIIRSLAEVLAAEHRLADQVDPVQMLKAVAAQLSVVLNLTREARAPLRDEVLGIAAQYAQFAGWLNAHMGRLAVANAWHDRALGWAAESGDADMTATTLNLKAHVALLGGKVGPMIGLSQAAQRGTAPNADVRALAVQLEARGHALAGDGNNAHRKLDEAARLIGNAAGDPKTGPPWAVYGSIPAYLALQRGLVYSYLGRNARAVEWLSAGLTELPPQAGQSELFAGYRVQLAAAHARARDPEQACSVAAQAVLIAQKTGSSRLRAQLDHLLAQLSARWPALPAVADLGELMS
jgi:tetratricopeptide (TPR) repeat protein